ncbi:MAG: hypothetical protein K9N49_04645 [Candidatus Marinimicrobia bacterium]|nr:hypothetical protein [Candidatus Neomarinimicrobiota bacterium]
MNDRRNDNKAALSWLLLLGLGVAAFWFLGRTQPIEVVTQTVDAQRLGPCADCGGTGIIETRQTCSQCNGSGKSTWKMGARGRGLSNHPPPCLPCGGTGSVMAPTDCPRCRGTGQISAATAARQTTRAGLSPWERVLAFFQVTPELNPAPQQQPDGAYPLLEKYLELWAGASAPIALKWSEPRQQGGDWIVRALVEGANSAGARLERPVEFMVRNREVIGARFL